MLNNRLHNNIRFTLQQKYLFSQQQLVSLLSTTTIGIFVIHNTNWYLWYPQQQLVSLVSTSTIGVFVIHNNDWCLCYPEQQMVSLLSTTTNGIFVIHNNNWYLCYPQQQLVALLSTTTIGIFAIHNNNWLSKTTIVIHNKLNNRLHNNIRFTLACCDIITSGFSGTKKKYVRNEPIIPEVSFQLPIIK